MARARRAAAALGAATLVGVSGPVAHAAGPAAPGTTDQGAPRYYNSGLAPTPYMGWNTYYGLGAPTESAVKSVADHLVSSGLRDSGYNIVWLDGGWQADTPRDSQGRLTANATRFPSGLPSLVTYLHQRGLKAGIYTDAGTYDGGKSCGLGSRGYYEQDARQFARWKFDAVKIDFLCGISGKLDPGPAFKEFSDALAKAGRPMLLNLCNPLTDDWGLPHTPAQDAHNAYTYGPTTGDSWRTGTDLAFGTPYPGNWPNILRSADANAAHPEAQGPGHYNDPDYLLPMRKTADGSYELNEEESTSQLVLWSVMGAPLVIGSDPRTLPQSMIDTLRNPEILAVDQDPLAIQGVRVASDATGDVYSKVLQGTGRRAVALLNRSDQPAQRTVTFADAGLTGNITVRDLRARQDRGTHTGSYTVTVPAHGTAFLKLSGTDAAPGASLGTKSSASPALVADGDKLTAFTRATDGALVQQTGRDGAWNGESVRLGGPTHGRILGQPAAYGSAGGRIDVFVRGTDDATYRRTFSGGAHGTWGAWRSLGGRITDAPGVVFRGPDDWTLFARGADGLITSRGPSGGWTSVGAPGDAPTYGRPSAVTDAAGRTHVAVRTADDSVWERVRSASGVWSEWTSLGGTVSGSPTLVAAGSSVYLFARASDYTLWQRNYSAGSGDGEGAWGGWFPRPPFVSGVFDGSLGGVAAADNTVLIAYRGVAGAVHQSRL
ncbi:glycoside hydrolase family 27 protein [Streptomyces sp. SID3212]|uniref:glycoside hydrolase family 27 protein n=1 Tax=Streptomyces sp. SID3212 TaxID=2690259 RepID=UPI00136DAFA9|nr:glycoside hydrolase family 27 protein [Streptomyces sp. SID3212]MYV52704.1 glycoside hydrolase family 27 protein [Streptomyces sp. SID3212]